MENLVFSLDATLPVFLLMVAGGVLGRLGFLPAAFCKAADRLTFTVTLPVMLFLDMAGLNIRRDFEPKFVLFCAGATLAGILATWVLARALMRDKAVVGEFVQAAYRSSAAILGVAFIQNIYGSSGMAPLMILGSVPLFNIFAVLILMIESPQHQAPPSGPGAARGPYQPDPAGDRGGHGVQPAAGADARHRGKNADQPFFADYAAGAALHRRQLQGRQCHPQGRPHPGGGPLSRRWGLSLVFIPCAVALGFRQQELVALLIMLGSPTTPSAYVMARNMGHEGVLTASAVAPHDAAFSPDADGLDLRAAQRRLAVKWQAKGDCPRWDGPPFFGIRTLFCGRSAR